MPATGRQGPASALVPKPATPSVAGFILKAAYLNREKVDKIDRMPKEV